MNLDYDVLLDLLRRIAEAKEAMRQQNRKIFHRLNYQYYEQLFDEMQSLIRFLAKECK